MAHQIVYDAKILGIVEKDGRVRVDLYCPDQAYGDQAFFPATIDMQENPKLARGIIAQLENIGPDELNDFVVEDFSGVARKTGRPFRITRFISLFQNSESVVGE